jgi:hypothetical protein
MLHRVALVRTDVSEELNASIIRVVPTAWLHLSGVSKIWLVRVCIVTSVLLFSLNPNCANEIRLFVTYAYIHIPLLLLSVHRISDIDYVTQMFLACIFSFVDSKLWCVRSDSAPLFSVSMIVSMHDAMSCYFYVIMYKAVMNELKFLTIFKEFKTFLMSWDS